MKFSYEVEISRREIATLLGFLADALGIRREPVHHVVEVAGGTGGKTVGDVGDGGDVGKVGDVGDVGKVGDGNEPADLPSGS